MLYPINFKYFPLKLLISFTVTQCKSLNMRIYWYESCNDVISVVYKGVHVTRGENWDEVLHVLPVSSMKNPH